MNGSNYWLLFFISAAATGADVAVALIFCLVFYVFLLFSHLKLWSLPSSTRKGLDSDRWLR